ncbi:MAG: hypothetical protein SGPRY_011934 [Prymnesium sp.]
MSMADPYEQMVVALMSPDNNLRNQAEAAFNQAKANPDQLVTALLTLLRNNADQQATPSRARMRQRGMVRWSEG